MEITRQREVALDGGDPEVGAPSVEDDREVLRGGSDADLAVVLGVEVVNELNVLLLEEGATEEGAVSVGVLGAESHLSGAEGVLIDGLLLEADTAELRGRQGRGDGNQQEKGDDTKGKGLGSHGYTLGA